MRFTQPHTARNAQVNRTKPPATNASGAQPSVCIRVSVLGQHLITLYALCVPVCLGGCVPGCRRVCVFVCDTAS